MKTVDRVIQFHMQLKATPCCSNFMCPACGGGGLAYPDRNDPAFMTTVLSDLIVTAANLGPANGREIHKLMKVGKQYIHECQQENFRRTFENMDRTSYVAQLRENAKTMPPVMAELANGVADAMEECDGTYEDFRRLKRQKGLE